MPRPVDDKKMWDAYARPKTVIEEGIWDRMKARGAGAKSLGVGGMAKKYAQKGASKALGAMGATNAAQELSGKAATAGLDAKTLSLITSYITKIEKTINSLNNDMSKLGLDANKMMATNPDVAKALKALTGQVNNLKTRLSQGGQVGKAVSAAQTATQPVSPAQTVGLQPNAGVPPSSGVRVNP